MAARRRIRQAAMESHAKELARAISIYLEEYGAEGITTLSRELLLTDTNDWVARRMASTILDDFRAAPGRLVSLK